MEKSIELNVKSDNRFNNDVNRVLRGCVDKLRNLVNIIMDSIFKNIYNVPIGIRIVCKFIEY